MFISDTEGASILKKDGTYYKIKPSARNRIPISSQKLMLKESIIRKNQVKELATSTGKTKD